MRAVDTDVLVRFLTSDDPARSRRAQTLLARHSVWIAKTVLLETEWVLRSLYQFEARRIADALERLLGLAGVHVENPMAVRAALNWFGEGLEFVDALHVASRGDADRFITFDSRFRRHAKRITGLPIESP